MMELTEKFIDLGQMEALINGIQMTEIISRNRRKPYGYNPYSQSLLSNRTNTLP